MMRFEVPWLLLLLLLIPVLLWWRRARGLARGAAVQWSTIGGLTAPGWRAWPLRAVAVLPWLALALAIVAAARPQRGLQQSEIESRGVDIMVALDLSASMRAQDMGGGNRLDIAKQTVRDFVRGRPHDRIGVVAFAGTAFTQCPLTLDHDTLLELLGGLDFNMTEDGTAIGMGLATAVQRLRDSRSPSKVVVLLTDGENNRGAIDPLTAAELARAMGVKVYTVLVGRPTMVPVESFDPVAGRQVTMQPVDVDEKPLVAIAQRTGGRFYRASDAAALSGIYTSIDQLERAPVKALVYHEYRDLGPWLLAIAALALVLALVSEATWAFRVP